MSDQPATSPEPLPEPLKDFFAYLLSAIRCQYQLVPDWLLTLLFLRVERVRNRIYALVDKLRAGTYRAPKPRAPKPQTPGPQTPSGETAGTPAEPAQKRVRRHFPAHLAPYMPADARLPGTFAWLNLLLRGEGRPFTGPAAAGYLQHLLQTNSELAEFARTCPALARHLRALCHMLGLKQHMPDYLKLPPRPRKPRAKKPPREKPKKFKIYKYWMRSGPVFADRQRRFGKLTKR